MTLACEDAHSKRVEFLTVADVDAEKRIDNSLVKIWKLKFGHKVKLLFILWAQGLVKIFSWVEVQAKFKLKFDQYFGANAWWRLWSLILVEILKLGLIKLLKFKFIRNADLWLRFWSWCFIAWPRCLIKIYLRTCDMTLVSRTQPLGPLCLWQCFSCWQSFFP